MSKHKLYKKADDSLHSDYSVEEVTSPKKTRNQTASAKTSKQVIKKGEYPNSKFISKCSKRLQDSDLMFGIEDVSNGQNEEHCEASTSNPKKHIFSGPVEESDSESILLPPHCSDSDSDSMDVVGFFSSSCQKLPYTYEEDEEIIRFVLKGQGIFKVGSILLWRHLEQKKENPKRTFQSLKNRFLRNIKPRLLTTYRHLIPNEETLRKILIKFPELKSTLGKKETLSQLKLPKRIQASEENVLSSDNEDEYCNLKYFDALEKKKAAEDRKQKLEILKVHLSESTSRSPPPLNNSTVRSVTWNNNMITVQVNLNFANSALDAYQSMGIYEKFAKLRDSNKLIPCPTCGRCGAPEGENNVDSEGESDVFISNSVESKKSERSSPDKRLALRRSKSSQSHKRRRMNSFSGICNQRSCSPSLLNDVNEVDELDENVEKNGGADAGPEETSPAVPVNEETNSTPLTNTDSIYQNTVAEFRKLIDSDEEELLVKKCLRKNIKTIGFAPNLSVDEVHVDSFFLKSDSPGLESQAATESRESQSLTHESSSKATKDTAAAQSILRNMLTMLSTKSET